MVKLIVDLMGGDNGYKATVEAINKFVSEHEDCEIVGVGDSAVLSDLSKKVRVIPSSTIAPMECSVMQAMRDKESSVYKAVSNVSVENADGVVSAGSTGAFLSLCTLILKKIEGISRPALTTPFPTKKDKYVILCDIGASVENNAHELCQFAKMGQAYASALYGTKEPTYQLISNGVEEGKGTPELVEAYSLMKTDPLFKGYVEGRHVVDGESDVVVFPGFVGNVFLKTSEGIGKMCGDMLKDAFTKNIFTKIGYLFAKGGMKDFKSKMDYKRYGGAMLIGVNKIAVKSHGNADARTFYNAVNLAYNLAKNDLVGKVKESLK